MTGLSKSSPGPDGIAYGGDNAISSLRSPFILATCVGSTLDTYLLSSMYPLSGSYRRQHLPTAASLLVIHDHSLDPIVM